MLKCKTSNCAEILMWETGKRKSLSSGKGHFPTHQESERDTRCNLHIGWNHAKRDVKILLMPYMQMQNHCIILPLHRILAPFFAGPILGLVHTKKASEHMCILWSLLENLCREGSFWAKIVALCVWKWLRIWERQERVFFWVNFAGFSPLRSYKMKNSSPEGNNRESGWKSISMCVGL